MCSNTRFLAYKTKPLPHIQWLSHTYGGSTTHAVALPHMQWLYHMYSGSTTYTVALSHEHTYNGSATHAVARSHVHTYSCSTIHTAALSHIQLVYLYATSSPIAFIIFKVQEIHKLWSLIQHTALTKTTRKGNRLVVLPTPPPYLMSLGADLCSTSPGSLGV